MATTLSRRLPSTNCSAAVGGRAAHLFGQSGIREYGDEVKRHATESLATETDAVERARMFMYLSNAEEVQGNPSESNYWSLRGLNITLEAHERLQQQARQRIGSSWLQEFLATLFDADVSDAATRQRNGGLSPNVDVNEKE